MKKLILFLLLLPILATSQNEWLIGKTIENSRTYKARWLPDLGTLRSDNISKAFYAMSKQNGIADNIQFAWLGESATKTRVSGIYNFATKIYSTVGTNDGTQTTELSQPYISGNIAPTEKYALRNPNGDDNHIVFPTQTLAGSWSISMSINWNGSNNTIASVLGNNSATLSNIMLKNTDNKFSFQNQAGTTVSGSVGLTNKLIGKNKIIHLAASGTALGIYIDGVLAETLTVNTDITLSRLMKGSATASREYFGDVKSICIRTGAITATQVISEYNFFRSIYPEIETVKIGSQDWATSNLDVVATPQGNVISEVTANTNVEKVVNGGFDSDASWTKGDTWSISGGTASVNNPAAISYLSQSTILTSGKWYKCQITINSISGGLMYFRLGGQIVGWFDTTGTKTVYVQSDGTTFYVRVNAGVVANIDNVSVQEIGWSGSTELYDGVYAATSGTVEAKTYAGVKAAAMWSYYNNDANVGAIYGKLYNWYAAKLLQMDIDYFNTANPSTPWGYRVPTQADFTTLQTTLGGSAVAGGKMKKEGLNYWTTPNTGADNSSGFSALGSGVRSGVSGSFSNINSTGSFINSEISTNVFSVIASGINTIPENSSTAKVGSSIRLIKQ